ncbi:hypothetical protein LQU94_03885 [Peptoniphilus sp. KCTC 25270]|uniref:hypothetical protein n=1 Tax=Peptoniphilus sp. KCTC 25270 TaxID=2897414 RepID=UPI001E632ECA|nr:hypothetical protein [Peptoniphilus sp. KCTC 25270]MCD1147245.1 hypothetical protein [Peptoniphilus sp. KCTC 25270]
MKWEERRKQNLYWTVSGNYERKYHGEDGFFFIAEKGILDLFFPRNQMENFFRKNISHLSNRKELEAIGWIVAIEWTKDSFFRLRPGIKREEFLHYEKIFTKEDRKRKRDFSEELWYQYARYRMGKPTTLGPLLSPMFKDMMDVKNLETSEDLFHHLAKIYKEYFYLNAEMVDLDTIVKKEEVEEEQQPKTKKSRKVVEEVQKPEEVEMEEIESAEFTNVVRDTSDVPEAEEQKILLRRASEGKTLERVQMHFGKSQILPSQVKKMEKDLATGIHKGMKLHITRGEYGKDMNSKFFEEQVLLQRQETMEQFEKDEHHYKRAIYELREILRKNLLDDAMESEWRSGSGAVDASLVWRHMILGDEKIFKKTQYDEEGSFSVDILLDMSASQQDRQSEVAIQGYLIAEALVELGIPTRVIGFCNLFHYQILRIFRDYKDDKSYNQEIFNYKASGSNRDGFALKYVFSTMEEIDAENQVLIVLSDGKPNDHIQTGGIHGNSTIENYEDEVAVNDTAAEILQGKLKNKAVLGVFTGEDEDLDQEHLIFGNDFVRITDLSRFSSIVGRYLKSVVDRL